MGGWWFVGAWTLPDRFKRFHLLREDVDGLPSKFRRKMVPKIWYFTVNAGAVFFLPFLSLYWRDTLGFTTQQIGITQALRPWVSAVSTNIISPLADVWDAHYLMLVLTYAVTVTTRGLITLGWSFGPMLALALIMESAVAPMGNLVDATVVAGSVKDGTYGRARLWASIGWGVFAPVAGVIIYKFGIHTSFMIFAGIYSSAAVWTFLIPAGLLGKKNKPLQLRGADAASASSSAASSPEGSTAGGVAAPAPVPDAAEAAAVAGHNVVTVAATGLTADTVSRRSSKASSHHSAQHVVVSVEADATAAAATPAPAPAAVPAAPGAAIKAPEASSEVIAVVQLAEDGKIVKKQQTASPPDEQLWPGLKRLFSDVYVITFMFLAFLMGVGNGFIGYLFLMLSDLGASGTLLGACLTMNCIGEVPFFYYSGAIIKKIGVYPALNIGMGAYCLRLGCYALLPYYPSLWIILPVELLQGLTFGLAYSAGTVHCRRIAPRNLRSTVQSIFSGLYTGVGAGIGGLAGGMLLGAIGGQWMCVAAAGALATGWAIANAANLGQYLRTGARAGARGVRRVGTALGSQVRGSFARLSPTGWAAAAAAEAAPAPDDGPSTV